MHLRATKDALEAFMKQVERIVDVQKEKDD